MGRSNGAALDAAAEGYKPPLVCVNPQTALSAYPPSIPPAVLPDAEGRGGALGTAGCEGERRAKRILTSLIITQSEIG